jgi:hypothetical protein
MHEVCESHRSVTRFMQYEFMPGKNRLGANVLRITLMKYDNDVKPMVWQTHNYK